MAIFKSKYNKSLQDLPKPENLKLEVPIFSSKPSLETFENKFDEDIRGSIGRRDIPSIGSKKPLFVKIEKYDEAVNNIEIIKNKLKDAYKILESLQQIKKEEDHALQSWHGDLNAIKEKINYIDGVLFDVR